ncbi:hypothetical protein M426DRAFT_120580 [Hypoxylon sp. CI-4A]|nr:hypothetical protein M426DRAFT_120580 [Hypoxylon sp. CI-4A]
MPCGCVKYYALYPCGHERITWELCSKAKARRFLKPGPAVACKSYSTKTIPPDLEETCGSTCLTWPFQCEHCGFAKQVGWRCSRCNYLRGPDTPVWTLCSCKRHVCDHLAVGTQAKALCEACRKRTCAPLETPDKPGVAGRGKPRIPKETPLLNWKCSRCSRKNRTLADAMLCVCGHGRCGHCKALFRCNCKCGCGFQFLEGGPRVCDWCVKCCSE